MECAPSSSPATLPLPVEGSGIVSEEIVFFDVETTVPSRAGQGHRILEFGAILVCRRRLVEVGCYSTLVRPSDLSLISTASVRCNGITRDAVAVAPSFPEVADNVYNILHGRTWAGHNIVRFDCARIREAFTEIGRPAPEPQGMIDSLPLLTQKFGRRAGNMKMATLASYFGLGQQKHRSLDDVRLNLEVLKYCATVLFLESSSLELSHMNSCISPSAPRTDSNPILSPVISPSPISTSCPSIINHGRTTSRDHITRIGASTGESSNSALDMDTSSLEPLLEEMHIVSNQSEVDCNLFVSVMPEPLTCGIPTAERPSTCIGFLEPDKVSKSDITTTLLSTNWHGCKMVLHHRDTPLQLFCLGLRVHFGITTKFLDHAGRPKLSILLDAPANLCHVLDACEDVAKRSLLSLGSNSEWRSLIKKNCFSNNSIVRLNIPTSTDENATTTCLAELYQKEPCGNFQKLDFSKFNASGLESIFAPGSTVDAYFGVDIYDYQQSAGIRLVAKRLIVHSR